MTRAKRRGRGRPSEGISETTVLVRMPWALFVAAEESAEAAGVSRSEWIREAMQLRLEGK